MPWKVRTTTELVHSGEDESIGQIYLGDGSVLHVIRRQKHGDRSETILDPGHLPEAVAELIEGVHVRLEAQRKEIIANIEAGIWTGEFNPDDGSVKFLPYDRTRIHAVVVSPLRVGAGRCRHRHRRLRRTEGGAVRFPVTHHQARR